MSQSHSDLGVSPPTNNSPSLVRVKIGVTAIAVTQQIISSTLGCTAREKIKALQKAAKKEVLKNL